MRRWPGGILAGNVSGPRPHMYAGGKFNLVDSGGFKMEMPQPNPEELDPSRRCILRTVLALTSAALSAAATSGSEAKGALGAEGAAAAPPRPDLVPLMFDLTVRIPPGQLDQWNHFWGEENVPALEENGQWLWGAWTSLTGQQNTVTHEWAYRDLAHYQAMATMRATNPRIHALAQHDVHIEESILSSVMTPLPYHPASSPTRPPDTDCLIATSRVFLQGAGAAPEYSQLMAQYVARAAMHGAELVGAFQSFFGWTPSYQLHVWRYGSVGAYWTAMRALNVDAECQRLASQLRSLQPHEIVELQLPAPYSRLR